MPLSARPRKFLGLFLCALLLLTGCARDLGSDEFTDSDVNSVQQSYRGTIIARRQVTIRGSDKLSGNSAGLLGGGVGGALLGSQFGAGRGQVVGGVLGAAAGALGGAFLERSLSTQKGLEYTIELHSGRVMTVVQGSNPALEVGQSVFVLVPTSGRPRVIADASGFQASPIRTHPRTHSTKKKSSSQRSYAPAASPSLDAVDASHNDRYAREQLHSSSSTLPVSVTVNNN